MTTAPLAVRPNLNALMEKAMAAGTEGVAMLKELVALSHAVQDREAREAYFDALRAFQAECPSIHKNKQVGGASNGGGSMQYRYADLDQIVSTVRPILDKHGLSFSFDCVVSENSMTATCVVRHRAGHSERSAFSCPATGGNTRVSAQQQAGGSYTFARRYALIGALGLATTDDDNDARLPVAPEPITEQQALDLEMLAKEVGADKAAFLRFFKIARVDDLPAAEFGRAMGMLRKKASVKA